MGNYNGKEMTAIKREKVKFLCDSILKNKPCRHGINCNFSHVVTDCPFGIKCMNVVCDEGTYSNRIGERTKVCTFLHKDESVFNFNIRVGITVKEETTVISVKKEEKEVIKMYIVTGVNVNENTWINIASSGIKIKNIDGSESSKVIDSPSAGSSSKLEVREEAAKGDTSCTRGGEKPQVTTAKILNKTQMCSSVVNSVPCRHGSKCRFAHDKYELTCSFGENCRSIEKKNERYINSQNNNYCCRLHPGETIDSLKERLGVTVAQAQPVQVQQVQAQQVQVQQVQVQKEQHVGKNSGGSEWITNAKVKMCMYVGRCREGFNCKYAHTKEEIECGYGNSCKNVCWDGCKYINTSNVKCGRRHPNESAEGVKWRCGK